MASSSIFRSPAFWGGVGLLAVGAGVMFHRRRMGLLGRGAAGPEPVFVPRNPARTLVPTEVRHAGGMTMSRYEAPSISIDERVKLIQARVFDGVNDPRIRRLAGQMTKHCGRDEAECEIKSIFDAVKKNVRYSGDIGPVINPRTGIVEGIDLYQSPFRSWEAQVADCDDHVSLISSLLAVIGHEVRMRVTAPSRFADWAHVFPVVGLPKGGPIKTWKAVDVTLPGRATVGSVVRHGKARDYNALEYPV